MPNPVLDSNTQDVKKKVSFAENAEVRTYERGDLKPEHNSLEEIELEKENRGVSALFERRELQRAEAKLKDLEIKAKDHPKILEEYNAENSKKQEAYNSVLERESHDAPTGNFSSKYYLPTKESSMFSEKNKQEKKEQNFPEHKPKEHTWVMHETLSGTKLESPNNSKALDDSHVEKQNKRSNQSESPSR